MRLVHLIHRLSGGGAERQCCYLATELAKLGNEVHVIFHQSCNNIIIDLPGVIMHKIDDSSNYDPRLVFRIFSLVERIRPDVITTWVMQMDVIGGFIARWLSIPWVLREPSCGLAYSSGFKFRLRDFIASGAAMIIANSDSGLNYWKNKLPSDRLCVIRNGVPVDKISEVLRVLANIPEKLSYPLVLSVGRLSADSTGDKNLKNLLKAVALINKEKSLCVAICGDGPQLQDLKKICKTNDLQEHVFFVGSKDAYSVWELMKCADVYVSLSSFEGCPNTVLEAMACECPLIVSDIPAHREILDDSTATFVNPNNPEQIASAILELLGNSKSFERKVSLALEKVRHWSVEAMAKKYEKAYLLVL